VLISIVCPRCNTSYQVQDELRGKAIRCPVPTCRTVFQVGDVAAPPPVGPRAQAPAPAGAPQQSGSVGDLVPLLPTEPGAQPVVPLLPAEAAPNWHDAPPVRRADGVRAALPPVPEAVPQEPGPRVLEAGDWTAPPVRSGERPPKKAIRTRGGAGGAAKLDRLEVLEDEDLSVLEKETPPTPTLPATAPRRGRLARWLIVGGGVLTLLFLAGGGVFVYLLIIKGEERLAARAEDKYHDGAFGAAASEYENLATRFPDSDKSDFYRFRAELSKLRSDADSGGDAVDLFKRGRAFIEEQQKGKKSRQLLREHAGDVGQSLVKMAVEFCTRFHEKPDDGASLEVVKIARAVIAEARKIEPPKGQEPPPIKWQEAEEGFRKVETTVAHLKERKRILGELAEVSKDPSYAAIVKVEQILEQNAQAFPDLARSAEVADLMDNLLRGHLARVKYDPVPDPKKQRVRGEEDEPAILFDPLLQGSPGQGQGSHVVLALARGVLYALDQQTGRARWAVRVGIDTTALPVRVPAQAGSRERILVLSSDTSRLTALDTDGNPLWRYNLESACLGQPVVVGQRAYLATVNGQVHEIELIEGKLLGRYLVGQRLTLGGTREPGTSRVFFPADNGCVYMLDVAKQRCENILYSRHAAGSLRGEVILLGPEGEDTPGHLVLTQSAGLNAVELRVFDLPLKGRSQDRARRLDPDARLEGWTWFRPYHDPEKLVLLSDAGVLGLFGIRQKNNRDQVLFPLLPGGGLHLPPLLGGMKGAKNVLPGRGEELRRGRAEVAQLQGDELWVMAANRLQRLRLAWGPDHGPRLVPAWDRALMVGSPLHGSQLVEERNGRTGLVVVTQPPRQAGVWATFVDDVTGDVRWRRQLGLVCEGEPVALAVPGQKPLFLVVDQGGALFMLDPERYQVRAGDEWLSDSRPVRLAEGLDENPDQPPLVVPAADGQSAHVIACPGEGKELVIRHVKVVPGQRSLRVEDSQVPLPSPLAGTPAIVGSYLLLPLASDKLARVPLPLPARAELDIAFDWRSERATPDTRGHVLPLDGNRFLTTDGGRQVRVWEWAGKEGEEWKVFPPDRGDGPTLELPDRIVAAPVRLPGKEGRPVRVCLADAAGKLTLAQLRPDGGLDVRRTWDLRGAVTMGPWVQVVDGATRVGCVVDRNRLVWVNPNQKDVLWSYTTPKVPNRDAPPFVGRPQLVAGMIVLADQAGRYVGLNPATGKPAGGLYELKGSIAPVCCPVAFHNDRLLAPLSDGTLLLLGVKKLRK
jgi:hypothetical protein